MDMDFGFNGGNSGNDTTVDNDVTNLDTGKIETGDGISNLENNKDADNNKPQNKPDENQDGNKDNNNPDGTNNNNDTNDIPHSYEAGTSIEIGENTYTIDEKGNAVDKDGNIFKEAKDVEEWIKSLDTVDESTELSIENIQEALGIEITDDNDKPIKFDNTPEGIKSYVNAVLETSRQENYETAINTLFQKYPILNDFLNYYVANGNSAEGFNELPDHSTIVIDENNEEQQIAIIKAAWTSNKNKGDVNNYINYLKTNGLLFDVAKDSLEGLKEEDNRQREIYKQAAEAKEQERIDKSIKYWNGVHEIVKSRKIAGYEIPNDIIIERNGQKINATPEDFFNYLYRVDANGKSAYARDLEKKSPEEKLNNEILNAYLEFTGGNYSNLVDMAINKKEVAKLKLKAKERNTSSVRVKAPSTTKTKKLDLGY